MHFTLQISPSCHTVSKALNISKKIPLTSKGGLKSKDVYMSCTIESSWYSEALKNLKVLHTLNGI